MLPVASCSALGSAAQLARALSPFVGRLLGAANCALSRRQLAHESSPLLAAAALPEPAVEDTG